MEEPGGCRVLVIAGTSSNVGKTSISVGLMAALRDRGLTVQAFKAGPDFLDPMHHEQATGRPSINLDGWMLSQEQCLGAFARHARGADIAIVEGVMGLFDGLDGQTEAGSTAQLAKWLGAPVLLVLDCSAIARSAAAVVKGYQEFDPDLRLGGLLLNKVGGDAHTRWLTDALEAAGIRVPVLGGVPQSKGVVMPERHHGLHMPGEEGLPPNLVASLAALVSSHVDLDRVLEVAASARVPRLPAPASAPASPAGPPSAGAGGEQQAQERAGAAGDGPSGGQQAQQQEQAPVRIAVARDAAFCFYYHDSLALLVAAGAELVPFSPLCDSALPPGVSGVYLGGGYPERHARQLAGNAGMRAALRAFAEAGGCVYAECGGLVYLSQSLSLPGEAPAAMAGVFPFKAVMRGRMAMGYCEVTTTPACPLFPPGRRLRGQVFHFSEIVQESVVGGAGPALGMPPAPAAGSAGGGSPARQGSSAGAGEGAAEALSGNGSTGCSGWQHGYLTRAKTPGAAEVPEGFCRGNVLASYVHLHFGSCPELADALVARCRTVDAGAVGAAAAAAAEEAKAAAAAEADAAAMRAQSHLAPPGSASSSAYTSPQRLVGSARAGSTGSSLFLSHSSPNLLNHERAAAAAAARGSGRRSCALDLSSTANGLYRQSAHPLTARNGSSPLPKAGSSGNLAAEAAATALGGAGKGGGTEAAGAGAAGVLSPPRYDSPVSQSPREGGWHLPPQQQQQQQMPQHSHLNPHFQPHVPPALHGGEVHHAPAAQGYHPAAGYHMHGRLHPASSWGGAAGSAAEGLHGGYPAPYGGVNGAVGGLLGSRSSSAGHLPSPRSYGLLQQAAAGSYGHLPTAAGGQYLPPAATYAPGLLQHGQLGHHPPLASSLAGYWPPPTPALVARPGSASGAHSRSGSMDKLPPGAGAAPTHPPQLSALHPSASARLARPPSPFVLDGDVAASGSGAAGVVPPLPLAATTPFYWQQQHQQAAAVALQAHAAATAGVAAAAAPHPQQQALHVSPPSDKIVSLSPGATEMLWVLGLANRVAATTDACDYPPAAAARAKARHSFAGGEGGAGSSAPPSCSSSAQLHLLASPPGSASNSPVCVADGAPGSAAAWEAAAVIDEQVLARERPGLIVCEEEPEGSWGCSAASSSSISSGGGGGGSWERGSMARAVLGALVSVGLQHSCRVVCIRRRSLNDVLDSMLTVGEAAGVAEEAARTVDRLRTRLRRLAAAAAQAAEETGTRPRVLVLQSLAPLRTAGWWAGDMVALAGGVDAAEGLGDAPRDLSWKEVQALAPDVLVVAAMHGGSAARPLSDLCSLAAQPGWWLLPAVRAGAVFIADAALFCRPGPRLVEGAEALAHMIQPDDTLLTASCPDRAVLKLSLRPGQRCRQRLLPNYFVHWT